MGEQTAITWCHHTHNPWNGCQRVSPRCERCYAEALDNRFVSVRGSHWGPKTSRQMFGDKHWKEPLLWNRKAEAAGERRRVFCASTADVFERRPELEAPRARLWKLIDDTPWLDWLLLTKRPENFSGMLPWWDMTDHLDEYPKNVWLGVTAENQEWADIRIPILIRTPCEKRFVSYEPALGPVDFAPFFGDHRSSTGVQRSPSDTRSPIDWLIYGDESGHHRRTADLDWARVARDSSAAFGVAFHCKQLHPTSEQIAAGEIAGTQDMRGKIHLPMLDGSQHAAFPKETS